VKPEVARVGATVKAVPPDESEGDTPDFFFTLFVELADRQRVTTEGLGRWYVGGFPGFTPGSLEDQLERAVRAELMDFEEPERWMTLESVIRREGLGVSLEELDRAPFVVELDSSVRDALDSLPDARL
jgi:hypothetical protein